MNWAGNVKYCGITGFKYNIHIDFFCLLEQLHGCFVGLRYMHQLPGVTIDIRSAAAYESVKSDRLKTFFQVVKTAPGIDKH